MMPERLPRCSEHPSSEHGTCKVHFVDDNSALQQVQYAIERFHEAPLEESARRAYRIALARGDADVAYRLMLNLWDNRSAREHQEFRDRIYADISPEIAKPRILQCTRAHIIQRGATVLSQSGPDGPVGLQGSIADLQFGIDTAQQIYDSAVSDGDWKTTAELLPGLRDRKEVVERIRQWIFDYLVNTEKQMATSEVVSATLARHRLLVDSLLDKEAPEARDKLHAALKAAGENAESRSHVLLTCRRVLKAVANQLYPPSSHPHISKDGKERQVGEDQFVNRILAYAETTHQRAVAASVEDLANRLDKLSKLLSKGVHADVSDAEMRFGIAQTYLLCGELLSSKKPPFDSEAGALRIETLQ